MSGRVMTQQEIDRMGDLEAKFMRGQELTLAEKDEFEELARVKISQPRVR